MTVSISQFLRLSQTNKKQNRVFNLLGMFNVSKTICFLLFEHILRMIVGKHQAPVLPELIDDSH